MAFKILHGKKKCMTCALSVCQAMKDNTKNNCKDGKFLRIRRIMNEPKLKYCLEVWVCFESSVWWTSCVRVNFNCWLFLSVFPDINCECGEAVYHTEIWQLSCGTLESFFKFEVRGTNVNKKPRLWLKIGNWCRS